MMAPMLEETIAQLKAELEGADVGPDKKAELLRLLASLREEATRPQPRREMLETSLAGLRRSIREFERTHPRLVEAVGSLATSLSNVGV
jgi:uncharacterized protein involved in exopolysaccharide biosynthesis